MLACLRDLRRQADSVRRRYDGLFNALPDPVSIIDAEGHILDLNHAGEVAYQRPREQIDQLLDSFTGAGQGIPINDTMTLKNEGGSWKICEDSSSGAAPNASY